MDNRKSNNNKDNNSRFSKDNKKSSDSKKTFVKKSDSKAGSKDSRKPSFRSDDKKPSFRSDDKKPSFRSDDKKPSFRSDDRKPSFRSDDRKPSFRSDDRKPSFRSDDKKPSFRSDDRKPSFRSDDRKPSFRSDDRKPSFRSDDRKPSFRSDDRKPFSDRKDFSFEDKAESKEFVYGRHPVSELLDSEAQINKIWIDENFKDTRDLFSKVKQANVPYQLVAKVKLDKLVGEVNHQGIVASISEKEYTEFHDLLELSKTKEVFFLVLDKVEDPHNLGAIIRTADATGVDAIIIPKHGAVGVTGVVSKTSAGALARMKICRVTNLAQTIEKLKEHNVWVGGVDMEGTEVYTQSNLKGNVAIVLGGEGNGISKILLDNCDFSMKIPMKSSANSLNVSVATAILCYEVFRQKEFK